MGADMSGLEERFEERMRRAHAETKDLGYNPTAFTGMVAEHGFLGATRRLLRPGSAQSGFERLWAMRRLDLTVESVSLEPEWRDLFSDQELVEARRRLEELHGS